MQRFFNFSINQPIQNTEVQDLAAGNRMQILTDNIKVRVKPT